MHSSEFQTELMPSSCQRRLRPSLNSRNRDVSSLSFSNGHRGPPFDGFNESRVMQPNKGNAFRGSTTTTWRIRDTMYRGAMYETHDK